MQTSELGMALIKRSEGFRGTEYNDIAGFSTIGYGHKVVAGEDFSAGITEVQAETILARDVLAAESAVDNLVKVALTQGQFDALVDFVFNMGPGRLAGSTLLRDLNAGLVDPAGEQLLLWDHSGTQEVAGLKTRRQAELALWSGTAVTSQTVA